MSIRQDCGNGSPTDDTTSMRGLGIIPLLQILLTGAIGCDALTVPAIVPECEGYAVPSSCPPFSTGGDRVISGVVLDPTSGHLVAGALVWAWVQTPTFGYSRGRVQSDDLGNYRIDNLPDALILLQAWSAGYDQPCSSVVLVSGSDTTAVLEVVPTRAPLVLIEPPAPALVGVAYEVTPAGPKPVAGARVYFETSMDLVAATTTSDESGRYSLCRLPSLSPPQDVTVVKSGYESVSRTVSVSGVMQLDFEMKPQ